MLRIFPPKTLDIRTDDKARFYLVTLSPSFHRNLYDDAFLFTWKDRTCSVNQVFSTTEFSRQRVSTVYIFIITNAAFLLAETPVTSYIEQLNFCWRKRIFGQGGREKGKRQEEDAILFFKNRQQFSHAIFTLYVRTVALFMKINTHKPPP